MWRMALEETIKKKKIGEKGKTIIAEEVNALVSCNKGEWEEERNRANNKWDRERNAHERAR